MAENAMAIADCNMHWPADLLYCETECNSEEEHTCVHRQTKIY